MKRNYPFDAISFVLGQALIKKIFFHEGGRAAAIYLYNEQKHLLPVYFQITIKKSALPLTDPFASKEVRHDHFAARFDGGYLIQSLPVASIESANYFSLDEQDAFSNCF